MPIGSGLSGQIGFVQQSDYDTVGTVTRFLQFNSESLKADVAQVQSRGIGSGRFLRTARHKSYIRGAAGSVEFDVMTKGFGLIFQHMLGSYANTSVTGAENRGRITPDAAGKAGLYLTTQVGRPDVGGTVRPYNYLGCKVTGWQFSAKLDDPLKLSLDLDAKTEQTSTALATASYATADEMYVMSEGAITLAGSAISVKGFTIKGSEGLATSRRFIGNTKKEPLANGEAMISGDLEFEHEALTRHGQWTAGTEVANLVATFTSPTTIPGGAGEGPFKLILNIPLIVFIDGAAALGGPDIVPETMTFQALNDGSNPVMTIDYHNAESAA